MNILIDSLNNILATDPKNADKGYIVGNIVYPDKEDYTIIEVEYTELDFRNNTYTFVDNSIVSTPISSPITPKHVPAVVTPLQARLALLESGLYQKSIDYLNSLSGNDKTRAEISWEYATTIKRDNYFIKVVAEGLGLSVSDVDDLFILANSL